MSKVITFSRVFPTYHPRNGEQTYFPEKLAKSFTEIKQPTEDFDEIDRWDGTVYRDTEPKSHTIRAGHRFKVGDRFSARVWSGRPYNSKQIILANDVEIVKVWDFKIEADGDYLLITIDNYHFYEENTNMYTQLDALKTLALNDGLSLEDMREWFKWGKPFDGQIICWNKNIEY